MKAEGARNALLTYDPLGRLSRVWDQTTDAATATRFTYDGDRLILETSDAGALRHFYVHGNAPDQPLVWWDFTGNNTRRFLQADQQGSIVAVTNGGTGGIVTTNGIPAINTYDPWGVPGANNAAGAINTLPLRFGYTGQAWIPELGMYYYKARFYYPALGRFLQTDPVGYKDQVNLYAYVGNDPVDHTDPSGLGPLEIGFLIYDIGQTISDVRHGASAGELVNDAVNIALDVEPVSGLREAKGAVEIARGVERGAGAARAVARVERTASGRRVGEFTRGQRSAAKAENAAQHGGRMSCTDCKRELQNIRSEKGVPTPANQAQVHHDPPIHQGGGKDSEAVVLCPECHAERHRQERE